MTQDCAQQPYFVGKLPLGVLSEEKLGKVDAWGVTPEPSLFAENSCMRQRGPKGGVWEGRDELGGHRINPGG